QHVESQLKTLHKVLFAFSQPIAWIVIFLVRALRTVWVSQLTLKVGFIFLIEVEDTFPHCPLHVGVDIHLDRTVSVRLTDFFYRRTRSTVEYKVQRLAGRPVFFIDEVLGVFKNDRLQADVSWLVYAMDVT